ncbi:WD40/YVTN/BNR-like repeat-containing protein [Arhodomonas sp. AD133]|uniref:WD40/YVTN/BNR-like repeat-containing protein n=1 Tax=Arhodomonas sp. AD133 TaxID=3415009 RepID=UPI003EBB6CC5
MTVAVLVGTRKGLFIARSDAARESWRVEGPHMAGYEIQAAWLDPRDPRCGYAAAHHPVWGIHVHRSDDAGHSWQPLPDVPRHCEEDDDPASLRMIWSLAPGAESEPETLYAGIEPPGLFVSRDGGGRWEPLPGFNEHPDRATWSPAKGGLAVHSPSVDPQHPERLVVALSAGGVYRTGDGGGTWQACNRGVRAPYLAGDAPESGHCVHRVLRHPARPQRLYQQSHNGTYVSDDTGDHWHEITAGLPSDFGYALATDPRDPDTVYTVPEQSSQLRATVDGRLRVYRSRDAGETWTALTEGLPQENVFVTILRDGLDSDDLAPLGLYLGTSSGHLFTSRDGGDIWALVAGFLPGILSVRAQAL